jgi:hypothetical protein
MKQNLYLFQPWIKDPGVSCLSYDVGLLEDGTKCPGSFTHFVRNRQSVIVHICANTAIGRQQKKRLTSSMGHHTNNRKNILINVLYFVRQKQQTVCSTEENHIVLTGMDRFDQELQQQQISGFFI